jgi:plasmid stabilization system protein ParE
LITPAARRDIKSIWRYIADDSLHHADLVAEAILATCSLTAELPGRGQVETLVIDHIERPAEN